MNVVPEMRRIGVEGEFAILVRAKRLGDELFSSPINMDVLILLDNETVELSSSD